MPKNYYTCKKCGIVYVSYRDKSDYCSLDCRRAARVKNIYHCDYCNTEFEVKLSQINRLKNGDVKHLYCSRECANKGQVTKVTKLCEWCGNEFEVFNSVKDDVRFCSRECYNAYGHRPNYCKCCNKPFDASKRRSTMYCSKKCQLADMYPPKIECLCELCNKPILLKPSEYLSANHHYCSKQCHNDAIAWSDEDKQILNEWYGIKTNYEISQMLSKPYSPMAVKSAASRYGIKTRERWSDEEKQYVLEHYENTPMNIIKSHLQGRSECAIVGIAHQYGLKSYYYMSNIWNENEDNLLRELYPISKTKDVAQKLNRSVQAVIQRANNLGIYKDKRIGACYKSLAQYIRAQNAAFHLRKLKENNFTCQITGVYRDVVIHHIYGFNLILSEAIEASGIELKYDFSDFSIDELTKIYELFSELQDSYDSTICISEQVHIKFHSEYGCGNNTPSQWNEFINKYYNS